jgi:hypothetical protein
MSVTLVTATAPPARHDEHNGHKGHEANILCGCRSAKTDLLKQGQV